ncbi:uncharacterized protein EI97DRAFT_370391 [Westerdykella ornata]|uniref:DUF7082 domain-containing protein n=1 Tax=Westerdykella ornata TaxID=318751 RepID=A0A6A6JRP0_WESOR|nr:uncharacterized protein EI97DRAFT_370391 [Westerdykella ornata]KAF2279290.1 hypothetical protein EI97DRAFT_370391 [Westerdykella ornata]
MSGYNKNQEQFVYDAAAQRPNQASSYGGLAQPPFALQYTEASAQLSHEQSGAEVPYTPTSTYESRGESSYPTDSSFMDARSRHPASTIIASPPEVTNAIHPSSGTAGTNVLLHLRANYDIAKETLFAFMFGPKRCEAAIHKVDGVDDYYNYALSVQVPPFPLTNAWNPTMMLKLRMEDGHSQLIHEIEAGKFTYTDMSGSLFQPLPGMSKKRRYSTEFEDTEGYTDQQGKRQSTSRLHTKPRNMSVASYSTASLSPLVGQSSLSAYGYSGSYDLPKQQSYTPQLSQKSLYAVPSGLGLPQADMKRPQMSPNLSSYGQYASIAQGSPASVASTPAGATVMPSPSGMGNPVLVRASSLAQSNSSSTGASFNPYLMYPRKAVLNIEGDLNSMTENWTREEFEAKRRLVQFERSQAGSTITTSFAPVTLETRPPRSICVSCILWEEKGECFITSVDTIFLLEQLVNVRFTVEEKNRIRRNLEGFRPLTVSKAKPDSEEFFKVIMGFPAPKPRNIEKDVKVFPWKVLSHALKKIIGKYSASYSSTAGAGSLPPPKLPSTYGGVAAYRGQPSPHTGLPSAATAAYMSSMTSTTTSPNLRASAGLAGQRDTTGQGIQAMTQSSWGAQTQQQQLSQYSDGLSTAGRGSSWDYGSFLNTSPATTAAGVPSTAQALQMQRADLTHALGHLPAEDPYQQYNADRSSRD